LLSDDSAYDILNVESYNKGHVFTDV